MIIDIKLYDVEIRYAGTNTQPIFKVERKITYSGEDVARLFEALKSSRTVATKGIAGGLDFDTKITLRESKLSLLYSKGGYYSSAVEFSIESPSPNQMVITDYFRDMQSYGVWIKDTKEEDDVRTSALKALIMAVV